MTDIRPLRGVWPQIVVTVRAEAPLDLGNVGAFLQRLNTVARRAGPVKRGLLRVEIERLETGSLIIKLTVLGLLIGSAQLAVDVAEALRSSPAAARACRNLIAEDNATIIVVEGGERTEEVSGEEVEETVERDRRVAARQDPRGYGGGDFELLPGPQTGIIRNLAGVQWVELDERPGLLLMIQDSRLAGSPLLQENLRYRLDGEAHIGRQGERSYFVVHEALILG